MQQHEDVLEQVFMFLPTRFVFLLSRTCKTWYRAAEKSSTVKLWHHVKQVAPNYKLDIEHVETMTTNDIIDQNYFLRMILRPQQDFSEQDEKMIITCHTVVMETQNLLEMLWIQFDACNGDRARIVDLFVRFFEWIPGVVAQSSVIEHVLGFLNHVQGIDAVNTSKIAWCKSILFATCNQSIKESKTMLIPLPETVPDATILLSYSEQDIAEQLALFASGLFQKLSIFDLTHTPAVSWKKGNAMGNIVRFMYNMASIISHSILSEKTISNRTKTLIKWTKIAKVCGYQVFLNGN